LHLSAQFLLKSTPSEAWCSQNILFKEFKPVIGHRSSVVSKNNFKSNGLSRRCRKHDGHAEWSARPLSWWE